MTQNKLIVEYTGPWRVKLEYFKSSGKFYSEGHYTSHKLQMFEIFDEVKDMLAAGRRPGLIDGTNEFYVRIEVPDHPHNFPCLVVPQKRGISE